MRTGGVDVTEELKKRGREVLGLAVRTALALCIGLVVGVGVVAFEYAIQWATAVRMGHDGLIWLLPVVGAAIPLLYRAAGLPEDRGTNLVLLAVRSEEHPSFKMGPLVFVAATLTHLVGGSSGRTGAALQIGGSLAAQVGNRFCRDEKERHILMMCGISAAFSALFGAPIAATVFAMEVVSVGVMYYAAMVPCAISALMALSVAGQMGVVYTSYTPGGFPALGLFSVLGCMVLGGLCGWLSSLFCVGVHKTGALLQRLFPNKSLCGGVGGGMVLLLTLLLGTRDYNGAGTQVVVAALSGQAEPLAFFWKLLLTSLTLGAGFKGGEVFPSLFIGATFGCVAGPLLGLAPGFAAAVGMACLFAGVTNCPITALLLGLELFGGGGMPLLLVAVSVSYVFSGYTGLYSAQKIVYSKSRAEFINQSTK